MKKILGGIALATTLTIGALGGAAGASHGGNPQPLPNNIQKAQLVQPATITKASPPLIGNYVLRPTISPSFTIGNLVKCLPRNQAFFGAPIPPGTVICP